MIYLICLIYLIYLSDVWLVRSIGFTAAAVRT